MSDHQHHLFAYCLENQATANQITQELKELGVELEQKGIPENAKSPVYGPLPAGPGRVILLITDNFLKSTACMNGVLEAVRSWADQGRFLPIVANGYQLGEDGSQQPVQTTFDRVSHIIQYMNHWQDKYLELRKEKRHHEEDPALDERLEVTKKISSDIGELLRYLRTIRCYSLEELHANKYAILSGSPAEALAAAQEQPLKPPTPGESTLVKMIEDSSEELMAENSELSREEEQEITEVDFRQIPGLDQLKENPVPPAAAGKDDADGTGHPHKEDEAALLGQTADASPEEEAEEKGPAVSKSRKKAIKEARQPEPPVFDDDDEEMNAILNEVLHDEDLDDDDDAEYRFLGDDPENPDEFDIDSLFDDEDLEHGNGEAANEDDDDDIGEDEVLLEMLDEEEEATLTIHGRHASAGEILEHAVQLFEEGQHQEAFHLLAETVEENPKDTTLRYYNAYLLARYGQRYRDAMDQLDTILRQDKEHVDALFLKGELAETLEDYKGAKKFFKKVAALDGQYPDIYFRLGLLTVQHFANRDKEAAGYFKNAVEHDPDNAEAHYLLATLLNERLGDTATAATHFKKTLELSPEHPFANYDLALISHRQNDLADAEAFYIKAIALNPELKTPQNDLAFRQQPPSSPPATEAEQQPVGPEPPVAIWPNTGLDIEDLVAPDNAAPPVPAAGSPTPQTMGPVMKTRVQDKSFTVLITGATAGIGRATAEIFAQNGHRVIATGRREDRLQALQEDFRNRFGAAVEILPFDVRDAASVKAAIEKLPEAWKNVDILINNAGLSRGLAPIHEGDLEHWDTMIDTNIKGLLYMTRAIAPGMVRRRSGHIINVSSNAGKEMYPGGNVYCATKAAVGALTKAMRLDLYQHNVRVSEVSPGHVEETEFARVRFDGNEERAAKTYENFQPLKSGDVAEAIYFIATRPPYVNIQDITMFGTQQAGSNFIDRSGRPD